MWVESSKTGFNLPLTPNSQPSTQNPPFNRPLMVGSELANLSRLNGTVRRSPSPHGRVGTPELESELSELSGRRPLMVGSELANLSRLNGTVRRSPSPHSRVGTQTGSAYYSVQLKSPSPHGRVGTQFYWMVVTEMERSPSPHGRVGTPTGLRSLTWHPSNRRPLMVGSELSRDAPEIAALFVRRPLIVGSEPLRGSTATDPSKLGHFRQKSPPRLYPVFKVLKTA